MSQLSYKTRKNSSIYGIPRVFFCCHPKDFDGYFDEISNEILEKQDCSIWHHGNKPISYTEEVLEDLSRMHLFVVPVTARFLSVGNPALEKEFRFAVEHHIPVLPLMQESGLGKEFNQKCGYLQFLDKYNADSTCIEYSEKLERFLTSVLLGDEQARRVRDAFDAYIFLSYRKKDRRHAQELMKLIHKNEFCRDIAIWYDEFLVPGEDFNDAISAALNKSKLFLLTVTPNLVNENNYIMNVEFPMAQRQGKPILPCEMVRTDKWQLSAMYDGIPECTDGHDSLALTDSLRRHFWELALRERDSSPEHLFFMGLAYLNGIDVEVNREYACELITAAAEQDLVEAIKQLMNMYTSGIGVEPDVRKLFFWQRRLLRVTRQNYALEKTFANAYAYLDAHRLCMEATEWLDEYDQVITLAGEHKTLCETFAREVLCDNGEMLTLQKAQAYADTLLGKAYHITNRHELAKQHFRKARIAYEQLAQELEDPGFLHDMTILYFSISQLHKVSAEYDEALLCNEKALRIQRRCWEKYGNEEHLLQQAAILARISELQRLQCDPEASRKSCLQALRRLEETEEQRGGLEYLRNKFFVNISLSESYRISGDVKNALEVLDGLIPLEEELLRRSGNAATELRVQRLIKTVHIYRMMAEPDEVIRYGEQAISLLGDTALGLDPSIATGESNLTVLYEGVALAYYARGTDNQKALKYSRIAVGIADKMLESRVLSNYPDVVMTYSSHADILHACGKLTEATECLEKAVDLYDRFVAEEEDMRNVGSGFVLYVSLGKLYMLQDEPVTALTHYDHAEELLQKVFDMGFEANGLLEADHGTLCMLKAHCYAECKDPREKDCYIKCIEIFDGIPPERYNVGNWETVGLAAGELYRMSGRFFKDKKWKRRLEEAAWEMQTRFPETYENTFFYEVYADTGLFG